MERITRFRAHLIVVFFVAVVIFFGFKLYDLQIIQTDGNTDNVATFTTWTRVKASRGNIMDTNGNLMVGNRASYDLTINHYVLLSADGTNNHLRRLIRRCQEENIEYLEHFPVSETRPFVYTLNEYSSARQGYFQKYLAYMGGLDSDITAPLLVEKLRQRYRIPADWSDEEARLVIGLRYELELRNCVPSLAIFEILNDVSDQQLSAIDELNIPGLNVEASTVREYNTEYAAHILGFVGPMSPQQWEHYKTIDGYDMDAEVGQDGLEAAFEQYLHGVDGLREDVVTTDGTLISSRYLQEPKAGANIEVTIDLSLQAAAEDSLSALIAQLREKDEGTDGSDAEGAAVVALDVKTGAVLVCASYPSYDLSTFFENYNNILEADYNPLYNRALNAAYPPGSTYKVSMVVAGIDSGTITAQTPIVDEGVFDKYPGMSVSCLAWSNYGTTHGSIAAAEALQKSCNYFFYELGDRLTINTIDKTAKGFGLGELTGIELPEEKGYRANPETRAKLHSGEEANFYSGNKVLASIGQDDNRFTPIQLAVYASTLANRGKRYQATFLNRVVSADYRSLIAEGEKVLLSHMEISDEAYEAYTEGMYMVSHVPNGTAYGTFNNYPINVASKTGTAQTGIPDTSDNGAFICFAPIEDPQIAIAVYGEKAGGGSTMAAVAKSILDVYFDVDEVGDVTINENQLG